MRTVVLLLVLECVVMAQAHCEASALLLLGEEGGGIAGPAITDAEKSRAYWRKMAEEQLLSKVPFFRRQYMGKDEDPTLEDFMTNSNKVRSTDYVRFNKLVVERWCVLFLDKAHEGKNRQRFLWAGAAAYAAYQVGDNIRAAYEMVKGNRLPRATFTEFQLNTTKLHRLGTTNARVYNDMCWQHLAYERGGYALLKAIGDKGELDEAALEAWELISKGDARKGGVTDKDIQAGNLKLLRREQRVVVQKHAFDGVSAHIYATYFGPKVTSPIPGGHAFAGTNIADIQQRLDWMPVVMEDFTRHATSDGGKKRLERTFDEWIDWVSLLRQPKS